MKQSGGITVNFEAGDQMDFYGVTVIFTEDEGDGIEVEKIVDSEGVTLYPAQD